MSEMPATLSFLNHLMILFFRLYIFALVDNTLFFLFFTSLLLFWQGPVYFIGVNLTSAKWFHSCSIFLTTERVREVRLWRIPADCNQRHNCQVLLIRRHIFIQEAFKSTDMLTAHSFCCIPPRHQSLLSDSPIKAEGLASCSSPPPSTLG